MAKSDHVAWIEGYTKQFVWIRVPSLWPNKILTLDRAILKHGLATAKTVLARVDPDSFGYGVESGYTADVELLSVINDPEEGAVETDEGASPS